jgi:hypothetical protein
MVMAPQNADLLVAGDKGHGKGRQPGQQQGRDQRRLAPDSVAVVTEDERSDRPRNKADKKDRVGLHRRDQRVGRRKVEFRKDQPGDDAVKQKIVPLYRRADRAGDHGAPQFRAAVDV